MTAELESFFNPEELSPGVQSLDEPVRKKKIKARQLGVLEGVKAGKREPRRKGDRFLSRPLYQCHPPAGVKTNSSPGGVDKSLREGARQKIQAREEKVKKNFGSESMF